MISEELKKARKEMLDEIEKRLLKGQKPEDSAFYCHSSEDRIVLSHALFWVMTGSYKGKLAKEKYFLDLCTGSGKWEYYICEAFGFDIPQGCGADYKSRKVPAKRRGRPAKAKTVTLES